RARIRQKPGTAARSQLYRGGRAGVEKVERKRRRRRLAQIPGSAFQGIRGRTRDRAKRAGSPGETGRGVVPRGGRGLIDISMSLEIHWHEGLFLQPHHLQRMQRAMHEQVSQERKLAWAYPYGLLEARVSRDELENMRIRFERLQVIMP